MSFEPHLLSDIVGDIVIAGCTDKGHVELIEHGVNFIPLTIQFFLIVTKIFYNITYVDNELGLQQIKLPHSKNEGTLSVGTSGSIANNRKLKVFRIILEIFCCPGLSFGKCCLIVAKGR